MRAYKMIELENTRTGLMARFLINNTPDPETVRLFGTNIIPCANYPDTMEEAVSWMRKKNPGWHVFSV